MASNLDVSEYSENIEVGLEAFADGVSDFLNPEGIEALENGDFDRAMENSDLGEMGAEALEIVKNEFGFDMKNTFGGKLAGISATGLAATLPSPEPFTTGVCIAGAIIGATLAKMGI